MADLIIRVHVDNAEDSLEDAETVADALIEWPQMLRCGYIISAEWDNTPVVVNSEISRPEYVRDYIRDFEGDPWGTGAPLTAAERKAFGPKL
jgi:hypothetical protein